MSNLDLSTQNLELLKKLLLIRLSSLGDILLTTPVLAALRDKFPDAQIDLVIGSEYGPLAPLLPGRPRVQLFNRSTGLIGLLHLRRELRSEGYDAVLDLHNNLRSRVLRRGLSRRLYVMRKRTMKRWLLVHRKLNLLREEPDVIGRYFETAQALAVHDTGEAACLQLPELPMDRAIAMAPGARHKTKRWPAQYFIDLGKRYQAAGYEVRLFGSSTERELCERVAYEVGGQVKNFAGELSLSGAALELAKCAAAITNDSGLMHLASAVGTPTVAIFGPTVKEFGFAPRAQNARVIENHGLYCRPCTTHGSEQCPEGHFRCMLEIEPSAVAISVDDVIEYYPPTSHPSPGSEA